MTEFEELYPYIYQCKNILDPWTFMDLHSYFFNAVDMGGLTFKKESDAPKTANRWLALQKRDKKQLEARRLFPCAGALTRDRGRIL